MKKIILPILLLIVLSSFTYAKYCTGDICTADMILALNPISADLDYDDTRFFEGVYLFTLGFDVTNTNSYTGNPVKLAGSYTYTWNDNWVSDLEEFPNKYDPIKVAYCNWKDMNHITISDMNYLVSVTKPSYQTTSEYLQDAGYFPISTSAFLTNDDYEWMYSERSTNAESTAILASSQCGFDVDYYAEQEIDITCALMFNPEYQYILSQQGENWQIGVGDILNNEVNGITDLCKQWFDLDSYGYIQGGKSDLCFVNINSVFDITYVLDRYDITCSDLGIPYYELVDDGTGRIDIPDEVYDNITTDRNGTITDPIDGDENDYDNTIGDGNETSQGGGDYNIQLRNIKSAIEWQDAIQGKVDILGSIIDIIRLVFSLYLLAFIIFEFAVIGWFYTNLLTSIPRKMIEIMEKAGKGL